VCVTYIRLTSKLDEVISDDEKVDRKDLFTLMGQMHYIYPNHVTQNLCRVLSVLAIYAFPGILILKIYI
jgi:hypothetical protein